MAIALLLFMVCLIASTVGSIVGADGGFIGLKMAEHTEKGLLQNSLQQALLGN